MSFLNTPGSEKSFDIECYRLANHFLDEIPQATGDAHRRLAAAIQGAIEDWLEEYNEQLEEADLCAYEEYCDSKVEEWRETGIRPAIRPFRRRA